MELELTLHLISELFDSFYVEEAVITTFSTFIIDGHTVNDFYTNDEIEETVSEEKKSIDTIVYTLNKGITYNAIVNYNLFLNLLSRYISSTFLLSEYSDQIEIKKDSMFVKVDVYIEERKETFTIGSISVDDKNRLEYVNGILY